MENIFTPPPISRQELLRQYLAVTADHAKLSLENTIANFEKTLSRFWESPDFTAQEQFDFYGSNACKLVEESDKVINFIKTYIPEYMPKVAIKPFTVNSDGTVTVDPEPNIQE